MDETKDVWKERGRFRRHRPDGREQDGDTILKKGAATWQSVKKEYRLT